MPRNGLLEPPHSSSLPATWFFPWLLVPLGVGSKPEPVPAVWRTDTRGLDLRCPEGVTQALQVRLNEVKPLSCCCNLFSKYDWRAALLDEIEPDWPEVTFVVEAVPSPCNGEGLAGTAAGPDGSIV